MEKLKVWLKVVIFLSCPLKLELLTHTDIRVYTHNHFIMIDSELNTSHSSISIPTLTSLKSQTLCISLKFHTVLIAILKPWSFGYAFRLSLLITFSCPYPPRKKHVRSETRNTILFITLSHNHRPLAASCPSLSPCTTLPCSPYNTLKCPTLTAVYTVHHRLGLLVTEYMGLFLFEFGWPLLMSYFAVHPLFLNLIFLYSWITLCFVCVTHLILFIVDDFSGQVHFITIVTMDAINMDVQVSLW